MSSPDHERWAYICRGVSVCTGIPVCEHVTLFVHNVWAKTAFNHFMGQGPDTEGVIIPCGAF